MGGPHESDRSRTRYQIYITYIEWGAFMENISFPGSDIIHNYEVCSAVLARTQYWEEFKLVTRSDEVNCTLPTLYLLF